MRRIIDLSGATASDEPGIFRLRLDKGCLLIAHGLEEEEARIPAHEVAVLILGHRLALTGAILGAVTANGGAVLVLDDRFRPSGLMLPIEGNSLHAERFHLQIIRLHEVAPSLWQQIVRAKIAAQARVAPQARLEELIAHVDLGDSKNVEATAARRYWASLTVKRYEDDGFNKALNYGYAVVRALVARAVCAAGLHPALGLHHRGGRNTFALADDLMEPIRPLVDRVVVGLRPTDLDKTVKRALLGITTQEVDTERGVFKLVEAYELTCQSLVDAIGGLRQSLDIPREGE